MSQKKQKYLPPTFLDLSNHSVNGQYQTEGYCGAGPYPYYDCVTGTVYYASCSEGGTADTSECINGGVHAAPACKQGSSAGTNCFSGSNQQF